MQQDNPFLKFSIYQDGQRRPKPVKPDPEAVELRRKIEAINEEREKRKLMRDEWE